MAAGPGYGRQQDARRGVAGIQVSANRTVNGLGNVRCGLSWASYKAQLGGNWFLMFPPEPDQLDSLRRLALSNYQLTGTLSPEWG